MHNWLGNFVGNDWFNAYAIGHLSNEQARRLWNKRIVSGGFLDRRKLSFEEMFAVSGGNMFLMETMYYDYIYGNVHPAESFFLQVANSRLLKALSPTNEFIKDPLKLPPK